MRWCGPPQTTQVQASLLTSYTSPCCLCLHVYMVVYTYRGRRESWAAGSQVQDSRAGRVFQTSVHRLPEPHVAEWRRSDVCRRGAFTRVQPCGLLRHRHRWWECWENQHGAPCSHLAQNSRELPGSVYRREGFWLPPVHLPQDHPRLHVSGEDIPSLCKLTDDVFYMKTAWILIYINV